MTVKPLKFSTHVIFWCCVFALFLVTVMLFKAVLLPFVLGIAVAYLLNPTVNKLGDIGIARAPAALMILGGFLILITAVAVILAPIVYREILEFSDDLPDYIDKFWASVQPITDRLDQYLGHSEREDVEAFLKDHAGSAVGVANYLAQKVASGGQAVLDIISVTIFMPIVAYFYDEGMAVNNGVE